jgi:hypothetical protein
MAAKSREGFTLRSVWEPAETGGRYRLILANNTSSDVANIRLAISGHLLINEAAQIANGKIVTRLANYFEIGPAAPMVLQPGAGWEITID